MSAVPVGTGSPLLSETGLTSDLRAEPAGETVETTYELIPSAAQRHIIKRPRLTRLLASAKGRILMLVAPAGFGKTTLAREWVADKPHAWYRGTTATADVAALAAGLSESLRAIVPGAGERMLQRMRATGTPEQDVQPLAELLAEDLAGWPDDAWLIFDDYQFAMESEASEQFVDLVVRMSPIRTLLASRTRPTWATARRLLYGELYEVGRNELAMTHDEAAEILAEMHDDAAPGLVALAEGWPAVLGMAARTGDVSVPPLSLPSGLHDYFAEELFQETDADTQWALCQLAVAPQIDRETIALVTNSPAHLVSEAVRLGFFATPSPEAFELHPLLRSFLEHKAHELASAESLQEAASRLTRFHIDRERWDDALALVRRFFSHALFVELLEALALPAIREARLHTLRTAVALAREHRVDDPVVDLARAELEYRDGHWRVAENLARHAAERLSSDGLASRAWFIAGSGAHLDHRGAEARAHHEKALARATTPKSALDAAWGCLLASWYSGATDVLTQFDRLEASSDGSADAELRLAHARALARIAAGSFRGTQQVHEAASHLVERAEDPLIKTSFLNSYGQCLVVTGRFAEALIAADELESAGRAHRLPFVVPYADRNRAVASMATREFTRAQLLLDRVDAATVRRPDPFLTAESAIVRARLGLSQGLYVEALHAVERDPDGCWLLEQAEYLATRALALACLHRRDESALACEQALSLSTAVEPRALVAWSLAVSASLEGDTDAPSLVASAFEVTLETAHVETFVAIYRATPAFLPMVYEIAPEEVRRILESANDSQLAKTVGLEVAPPPTKSGLSPREREVLALVVRGLTNREIAAALWISESTAKVHVHHILSKLGVRSRAQAASRAASLDL